MARFRIWWLKNERLIIIIVVVIIVVLIAFAFLVYIFGWNWTGINGGYSKITTTRTTHGVITTTEQLFTKTLWDWLQLLIIPLALAIIAILFNRAERKNEQRIASDNQQEAALQEYIKEMSELLLHENLRESQPGDEVRTIARVRTLTVLRRLDTKRKGSLLMFLYESNLIVKIKGSSVLPMGGADLSGVDLPNVDLALANLGSTNLSRANLCGASLNGATLSNTNLSNANLSEANMSIVSTPGEEEIAEIFKVNLRGANLSGANLRNAYMSNSILAEADLSGANLSAATVTPEQLAKAKSLTGATLPDGSTHP